MEAASSTKAIGKGVLILLNDEIGAAREIRKVISHRMEKYESGDLLNIGYVDDFGLESCRTSLRKHATATKFDISGADKLPRLISSMIVQELPKIF